MPAPTRCVYCRAEPLSEAYRPFCSERCKMADLGRWLKGDYAVPAVEIKIDGLDAFESGELDVADVAVDPRSGDDR